MALRERIEELRIGRRGREVQGRGHVWHGVHGIEVAVHAIELMLRHKVVIIIRLSMRSRIHARAVHVLLVRAVHRHGVCLHGLVVVVVFVRGESVLQIDSVGLHVLRVVIAHVGGREGRGELLLHFGVNVGEVIARVQLTLELQSARVVGLALFVVQIVV